MLPAILTARELIDSRGRSCILLFTLLKGESIIKKALGITLALVIGGCVVLITLVLVLQVILSLLAAG